MNDTQAVVLVPVLGRPHRAAAVHESLRSTSDCRMLFLCSPGDQAQIEACAATGAETVIVSWRPGRGDFARKTNEGFRLTDEPWVFCGADDLRFHAGWLQHALLVGERSGVGVVGTQDMGNPLVKKGAHATHPLIRRSYIAEQGGTFDGSGAIYSETYDHQFVDTELIAVAKARGQWAFAARSVVEHLHPHWGRGENDATYEKAMRDTNEDRDLYVQRSRRFATLQARRTKRR